jgi:hypothetical protein
MVTVSALRNCGVIEEMGAVNGFGSMGYRSIEAVMDRPEEDEGVLQGEFLVTGAPELLGGQ